EILFLARLVYLVERVYADDRAGLMSQDMIEQPTRTPALERADLHKSQIRAAFQEAEIPLPLFDVGGEQVKSEFILRIVHQLIDKIVLDHKTLAALLDSQALRVSLGEHFCPYEKRHSDIYPFIRVDLATFSFLMERCHFRFNLLDQ